MSPLRLASWWVAAQLVACAPSELGPPLPAEVQLIAVGTTTLSLDRLRIAGLYSAADAIETTADVSVTATGAPVIGTLMAPAGKVAVRNLQIEVGELGNFVGGEVRFFGYLDADGSGDFSNGPDLNGPDQVVAAAPPSPSYAWLPELGTQLLNQTPEAVEEFYSFTAGRYTAFLPVRVFGSDGPALGLSSARVFVRSSATRPTTIPVSITSPELARHTLLCPESLEGEGLTEAQVRVDPSAGGEVLCALAIPDCTTTTVAELQAPDLPLDEVDSLTLRTTVQCRRSGRRESLVVEVERLRCSTSPCHCERVTRIDAIVTSTGATPTWWPCGNAVDFCDSSLPLYRADPSCLD